MKKNEVMADGEYREYYDDNSLKSIVQIEGGKKNGSYVEYFQNSNSIKVEANFKDGLLDGEKREFGLNGKLIQKQNYKNGNLHGEQVSYGYLDNTFSLYDNGQIKQEKVIHTLGGISEVWTNMIYKDGKEWSGFRKESVSSAHGDMEKKKEYSVKEGKLDGPFYEYHYNCYNADIHTEVTANYSSGELTGSYKEFDKGDIKEGSYKNKQFSGTETIHLKGRRKSVSDYKDGELVCTTLSEANKFTGKNEVISEIRPNGACIEYDDGIPVKLYEQKDGKKNGKYEELDKYEGWVKTSASYLDDKLNGFYRELRSDGTIAKQLYYKDGEDITKRYETIKGAAALNVDESTGKERKVNPKQTKLSKAVLAMKLRLVRDRK